MTFSAGQKVTSTALSAGSIVARHTRVSSSSTTTSSTGIGVVQLSAPVVQGRLYWVGAFTPVHLDSTVTTDILTAFITYTTNGSTPTASSPILSGAQAYGTNVPVQVSTVWVAPSTGTLKIWLCVARYSGSGNGRLYIDGSRTLEIGVVDRGVDTGPTGGTNL